MTLRNKHNQLDTHFHLHFIKAQSLDIFRTLLAHLQERRFWRLLRAVVDVRWSQDEGRRRPTHIYNRTQ
jgi:hypothetical protein